MTLHATPTTAATDFDLLGSLHKALRCCMFEVLVRVGRVDVSDGDDVRQTRRQVQRLLDLVPEASPQLRAALPSLGHGPLGQRAAAAQELYLALSAWTIGQLQRLAQREATLGALPAASPIARAVRQQRQLAALSDAELREALHWLGQALTPQELAAFLAELQSAGGDARFCTALETLSASLDGERWDRLARAMGMAQVTLPAQTSAQPTPLRRAAAPHDRLPLAA